MNSRLWLLGLTFCVAALGCIAQTVPEEVYSWKSPDGPVQYDGQTNKWYLKGEPYSGRISQRYATGATHRELDVSEGVPDGVAIWYLENGIVAEMMTWSKGKLVGAHCRWSENGELREVSSYVDGKMQGVYASLQGPGKDPADRSRVWQIDLYENGKIAERFHSKNTVLQNNRPTKPSTATKQAAPFPDTTSNREN